MNKRTLARLWLLLAVASTSGVTARAAGEGERLESEARQRLLAQPSDAKARFDLARALTWQQRWDKAHEIYGELLASEPENPDYLLGMAQVWRGRGRPADALRLLADARALAPGYEDVWRAEISALIETGDALAMARARTLRESARNAFPNAIWLFPALDIPAAETARGRDARVGVHGAARRSVVEVALSHDALTGDRADWQGVQMTLERHLGERRMVYGSVEHTRRFGLQDDYAQLGVFMPLAPLTTLQLEGAFSPTHHVRASRRLLAQVQQALPRGWEIGGGIRLAHYDYGSARQLNLGLERYWGQHRAGYTLFLGGPVGSGHAAAHRLQWAYYLADRDWVALTTSWGRETEHDGQALRSLQFAAVSVSGQRELSSNWTLIWDVGRHRYRQGYARTGLRVGLRRTF